MKKLLGILSSISLIAGSSSYAIACGANPYDNKTKDGDSILMHASIGDKDVTIDSSDVLWKLINESGPSNKSAFVQEILQLLSASFLTNAKNTWSDNAKKDGDISLNKASSYYLDKLADILTEKYENLENAVSKEIEKEKKDYKDKSKKGEKEWKKMLESKFAGFKDIKVLEEKYRQYKLLTNDENVTTVLLDTLLKTNQLGVEWQSVQVLQTRFNTFIGLGKEELTDWFGKAGNELNKVTFAQLKNSFEDDKEKWVSSKEVTLKDVNSFYDEHKKNNENENVIKNQVPYDISELSQNGVDSRKGFISNAQRFFLEKYFETQAPLAISDITFAYSTNGKMTDGITEKDFKDDQDHEDITKFITAINDSKQNSAGLDTIWNRVIEGTDAYSGATATKHSTLMTLSNSKDYNQMFRNSVYDYVNGGSQGIDLISNTLKDLISATNRGSSSTGGGSREGGPKNMYAKIADGIIAFIDDSGLHFVRIDGFRDLTKSDKLVEEKKIEGITDNKINSETMVELESFNKFIKENQQSKTFDIQNLNNDGKHTDVYNGLNTTIVNPYLKFLVNNSLVTGLTSSITNFDIMKELQDFVKIQKPDTDGLFVWQTALLSYFESISKGYGDLGEFIDNFLIFGDESKATATNDPNEIAKKMKQWIINQINNVEGVVINNPINSFIIESKKENDSIKQKTDLGYPKNVFDVSNTKIVAGIKNMYFKSFKEKTEPEPGPGTDSGYSNYLVNKYFRGWN